MSEEIKSKKPRTVRPKTSIEAVPQLATLPERVTALEIKIENNAEKLDDLKVDVKEMHDCLDRTGDKLTAHLELIRTESNTQHAELASKVKDLEQLKNKGIMYLMIALAFAAGSGWIHAADVHKILQLLGL